MLTTNASYENETSPRTPTLQRGAAQLRDGWHHSRFQPYLKMLAPAIAPEATLLGTVAPRTCAEIDVGALINNAKACADAAAKSGTRVMAVVKADAYGHGAAVVARVLHRHCGIDFFAVATLPEALELRAAGLDDCRVLVLGASVPSEWPVYARFDLEMVIESKATADRLASLAPPPKPIKAHVMLNTGMNRIGLSTFDSTTETHGVKKIEESRSIGKQGLQDLFNDLPPLPESETPPTPPPRPPLKRTGSGSSLGSTGRLQEYHGILVDQAVDIVAMVAAAPAVEFAGLCTHMADAQANIHRYTQRQFKRFRDVVDALRDFSLAQTAKDCGVLFTVRLRITDDDVRALAPPTRALSYTDTTGRARVCAYRPQIIDASLKSFAKTESWTRLAEDIAAAVDVDADGDRGREFSREMFETRPVVDLIRRLANDRAME